MTTAINCFRRAISACLCAKTYLPALPGVLLASASISANAARYYVDGDVGDDSNFGDDWGASSAFKTIEAALDVASSGDEIWVAASTNPYYPDEGPGQTDNDRFSTFNLSDGVSLYAGFAGNESNLPDRDIFANPVSLSGDIDKNGTHAGNSYRVVTHTSMTGANPASRLDGFTITMGHADGDSSPVINTGAGMIVGNAASAIINCNFVNNKAGDTATQWHGLGAGLYVSPNFPVFGPAKVHVYNSTFRNNVVQDIGSVGAGGGIYFNAKVGEFVNCLFENNECLAHQNQGGRGGAMYAEASFDMYNCTIAENTAESAPFDGFGGGLYCEHEDGESYISNCIFWDNADSTCSTSCGEDAQIYVEAGTVTVTYSDVMGGWTGSGSNNINLDPEFVSEFRLGTSSPCIDQGVNADVRPDTFDVDDDSNTTENAPDLKFRDRISGTAVDMGCYECPCPADFDEDGAVDFDDFTQLLAEFGSTCPCETDLDGDGDVDFDDFTNLLANFGPCPCEGEPGLTLLQEFLAAGLDEDDYDDYLDIMENGTQQRKDCWTAWLDHYLNCSPSCAGSEVTECDDPFLTN